ncbi:MAG: PEP/pyruvate-binding domain-containing protein [Candidatus Moranbacteria bacterium]|nr:PEP/pyruvate-binding domain-containing protein [Candidatus Moranbacteria bacterium]
MIFIKNFNEIGKGDAALAGGKGASLGEMTQTGIPVPPGFVVLADAFEKFLDETDLNTEIDTILHTVNTDEMRSVEHASERIQKLILEAKMPADIGKEIQKNFKVLDVQYVAVRSSATAEDSDSAAWAGQLDTFLNTTEETLLENVQKCWASLFTSRAVFYRFEKELHQQKISVAVVVQKMIQSEISGIAFSVHPVTEDRNQLIIEAGWGLGEAIVSGQITPDSYVVEKDPRRIIDTNIAIQERGIYRSSSVIPGLTRDPESKSETSANEWREIPENKREKQKLSEMQILELAELVIKIEKHYGFPCDIEWALMREKFYITQSRPITTLSPQSPVSEDSKKKLKFEKNITDKLEKRIAHYLSEPMIKMGQWSLMPVDMETWYVQDVSKYFEEFFGFPKGHPNFYISKTDVISNYAPESFFPKLFSYIRNLTEQDFKGLEKKLSIFLKIKKDTKKELSYLTSDSFPNLSTTELIDLYKKNRDLIHRIVIFDHFGMYAENYWPPLMHEILTKKFGLIPDTPEYHEVLFTLSKPKEISISLEEKRDVLGEALRVKTGEESMKEAAKKLAEDFGWLPVFTYGTPWDERHYEVELEELSKRDVAFLKEEYEKLKNYSDLRDQDIQKLVKKHTILPLDLQIFVDFGLAVDVRNEAEFVVSLGGYYLLPMYKEMARRLKTSEKGLRLLFEEEIIACLEGRADSQDLLKGKKNIVAWGFDESMRKRINFTEEEAWALHHHFEAHAKISGQSESDVKKGVCASSGKARGVARILKSPAENASVKSGDILISYATTVDYLSAMKNAAAIVTETGGLTCHAAVVSREFGIPCIVGLKNAMSDFRDGDLVEVDADNGVVKILTKRV